MIYLQKINIKQQGRELKRVRINFRQR